MSRADIPYIVRGGLRYFEQAHIKDVLAYLKILANFKDEASWTRVLKMYDGVGPATITKIWNWIRKFETFQQVLQAEDLKLSNKAQWSWEKVRDLFTMMTRLEKDKKGHISDALRCVMTAKYEEYLKNNFDNHRDRQDDLRELVDFVYKYQSLENLLADLMLDENYSRDEKKRPDENVVVLSTIHQAKGLEWPHVFVIGLRDGQFPHHLALEKEHELEEERRLFYVAVTRAQNELVLVYPEKKKSFYGGDEEKGPSMFIKELGEDKYTVLNSGSSYRGNRLGDLDSFYEGDTIYY